MIARSWVEAANEPEGEFPLANLPCGVFSTEGGAPRCGTAIGDRVLDLKGLARAGLLGPEAEGLDAPDWNAAIARGPAAWASLRARLTALLAEGSAERDAVAPHLVAMADARMHLPVAVRGYTDFYASRHHATNVGTIFRGAENALPPNWLHLPIGYNGRASTVVASGADVVRPMGQTRTPEAEAPSFGPTEKLDYEMELGAVVGVASPMGSRLTVAQAEASIFGYVLLNDWSARDVQAWEYQPLGPFQSKAFATTISPWIVTAAALAPFRVPLPPRAAPVLPHLVQDGPGGLDVALSATLRPEGAARATPICATNARELYWSAAQQLAHHASSGCAMEVGDLLGSGTISGPAPGERGSLLEASWNGTEPVALEGGGTRTFLRDGDVVTLRGAARGDGYRVGFGECTGRVVTAR